MQFLTKFAISIDIPEIQTMTTSSHNENTQFEQIRFISIFQVENLKLFYEGRNNFFYNS